VTLPKELREKVDNLHRDLVIFNYGHNPRPEHSWEETALILFEETVAFVKSLKDKLNDEKTFDGKEYRTFPMRFLAKEDLNRRMVKQETSWSAMNDARSVMHCFLNPERYGYRGIILALWKDEQEQIDKHDREHYKTKTVRDGEKGVKQIPNPDYKPDPNCYLCKYYKKQEKKRMEKKQ